MLQTDRDNQTETIESPMKINIPHYGIDLRVILLALKSELISQPLCFAPKFEKHVQVVVPTLRRKFKTRPVRGFLVVHYIKDVKIPIVMDGDTLSDQTIDVLSIYLEKMRVNYPKPLPSSKHEHIVRFETQASEFL